MDHGARFVRVVKLAGRSRGRGGLASLCSTVARRSRREQKNRGGRDITQFFTRGENVSASRLPSRGRLTLPGQQVYVDNNSDGGGAMGAAVVARASASARAREWALAHENHCLISSGSHRLSCAYAILFDQAPKRSSSALPELPARGWATAARRSPWSSKQRWRFWVNSSGSFV